MLQLLSLFLKSHLKRMSPLLGETFSLLTTVVIFGLRLLPNLVLGFLVVDLVVLLDSLHYIVSVAGDVGTSDMIL